MGWEIEAAGQIIIPVVIVIALGFMFFSLFKDS